MIEVISRTPTAAEYAALRESVGWKVPQLDDCTAALDATVDGVVAELAGEVVAMGRIVGDGLFYSFIVDLVVRPEHQGAGMGSQLLGALLRATALRSTTGLVQLVAEERLGSFYERNGFRRVDDGLYSRCLTESAAGPASPGCSPS